MEEDSKIKKRNSIHFMVMLGKSRKETLDAINKAFICFMQQKKLLRGVTFEDETDITSAFTQSVYNL